MSKITLNDTFPVYFQLMSKYVHANAVAHGWWEEPREDGTLIALIMSEAAEALEALRKGNKPDEHCPQFSGAEVELADVVIRRHVVRQQRVVGQRAGVGVNKSRGGGHGA